MDVTQLTRCLGLGDQTVKNLLWLGCKFDLDQSERKSSQVNASARKHWSNGIASRPKFSTCFYLRLRLTRALSLFQTWLKPWPNGPASSRQWTQVELAERLAMCGQTDSQVSSDVQTAYYPLFHWLTICVDLAWVTKRWKTCFDLRANSWAKWAQVHASPGQTESQVDPGFQLASTCDSVWPGL